MNGVHDMGGMHGMGPVVIEKDEPVFHSRWEARMYALQRAAGFHGRWNTDMSRFSRERMPPADYLAATYYERWLFGLETLLVEQGLVTAQEMTTGRAGMKAGNSGVLRASAVAARMRGRSSARDAADVPPTFKPGDSVLARTINPTGHTRLPRYVRGRRGTVNIDHGVFTFPDTNATSGDPKPQHCYSVRFDARELWGPEVAARDSVYLDLFDDYLDAA
ncbi:MAG: nitrile hydratase subunit beta [Chloroflexi bacterium 13_1_40CM_67_9]|nr:MAG: nitrile hydratase subunit beta [Chloroflexi bacterium 13_1_40CM_67_9]